MMTQNKTIDVAKIIKNEQRLQQRVLDLERQLIDLNDSIRATEKQYHESLNTINRLNGVVELQYKQINDLTLQDLEIEKKKSNNGFYSFFNVGSDLETFNSLDVGIQYLTNKTFYSFAIDPLFAEEPIFKIGVGFKL